MVEQLDNAKVIMISEKGQYGHIQILGLEHKFIEVCYLAICKYESSDTIYLFLCDENMSVEQDRDFDSRESSIIDAERRTKVPIVWAHSSTAV